MVMNDKLKLCNCCLTSKSLKEFTKNSSNIDNLQNRCRECINNKVKPTKLLLEKGFIKCYKCNFILAEDSFYKDTSKRSGFKSLCKSCCKIKILYEVDVESKICCKCKLLLSRGSFSIDHRIINGLSLYCKKCKNSRILTIYTLPHEFKRCYTCNIVKGKNHFSINIKVKSGLHSNCKSCNLEYRRLNRTKYSPKKGIDKFKVNVRNLILQSFKRACKGKYIKSEKTESILGCSVEKFMSHIELLFLEGMDWNNHGRHKVGGDLVWHIDHKVPLASAKTEEDIKKLCHYSNLQPLWAIDNIRKSDKLI